LAFLLKNINKKIFDSMLGFAAGVACCNLLGSSFSLLRTFKLMSLLQVAIGFLLEGISIRIINKIF
jgi:zinc transporter ZupT